MVVGASEEGYVVVRASIASWSEGTRLGGAAGGGYTGGEIYVASEGKDAASIGGVV